MVIGYGDDGRWMRWSGLHECRDGRMGRRTAARTGWASPLVVIIVGTSFPNMIASVIVAKMGQSDMAIANALGSNIQNVFLALGFPWLANAILKGGQFRQKTAGITAGVISMVVSLVLFILFLSVNKCQMGRCAASMFILAYVGFVAYAVYDSFVAV